MGGKLASLYFFCASVVVCVLQMSFCHRERLAMMKRLLPWRNPTRMKVVSSGGRTGIEPDLA